MRSIFYILKFFFTIVLYNLWQQRGKLLVAFILSIIAIYIWEFCRALVELLKVWFQIQRNMKMIEYIQEQISTTNNVQELIELKVWWNQLRQILTDMERVPEEQEQKMQEINKVVKEFLKWDKKRKKRKRN